MAKKVSWPLKVNLVEETFWEPYDSENSGTAGHGNIMDWASDSAWDEFQNLDDDTCSRLIQDLIDAFLTKVEGLSKIQEYAVPLGPKDWSPKQKTVTITDEDLDYLCEHVTDFEMESVRQAMVDAFTLAWEEAYMPEDQDLERALESSVNDLDIPNTWTVFLGEKPQGPKDWSPLQSFSTANLVSELFGSVSYEREENRWDRFLVFDWMNGPAVRHLRRMFANNPEEYNYDEKDFESDLEDMTRGLVDGVVKRFQRMFAGVDISHRVHLRPHWKTCSPIRAARRGSNRRSWQRSKKGGRSARQKKPRTPVKRKPASGGKSLGLL